MLVIEDVHWADEATLDLLRFLGRRIRHARALVLVTYRDEGLAADDELRVAVGELSTQRSTRRMSLPPLSEAAVAALADGTGVEAGELHRLTGGNPFFVTEVLRTPAGTCRRRSATRCSPGWPDSPRGPRALEVASLIGARMEPSLLVSVTGAAPATIDELVNCGVLVGEDSRLRFRHEIARMAVQATIPPHRAAAAHRAILDVLLREGRADEARLAYHAEGAGDDTVVLEYAPRPPGAARPSSARTARRRCSSAGRSPRPPPRPTRRAPACTTPWPTSSPWSTGGRTPPTPARRRWGCGAGRRPAARGRQPARLSRTMWRLCRGDEAERTAVAAVAAVEPLGPCPELAWVYANLANHRLNRGEYDEASGSPARPARWPSRSASTTC